MLKSLRLADRRPTPDDLAQETLDPSISHTRDQSARIPWLTVLHHPELARIGEEASLNHLSRGTGIAVSRTEPSFSTVDGAESWPLADPFLSRSAVTIRFDEETLEIAASEGAMLSVDGAVVHDLQRYPLDALDNGLLLELGGRVILLLHRRRPHTEPTANFGLVGASEGIESCRRSIQQVAGLDVPVLIRGQTGSGKELVARALHDESVRSKKPFEALNVAALAPNMAVSDLFGYVRGAFTGAVSDNPGYFLRAQGGTLFLDEIGDATIDVQLALLRALETKKIQPVGAPGERTVDVRIVSATDADLDRATGDGRFRLALLHRLRAYEIHLPPLSERREDLGRLVLHFLRENLTRFGDTSVLQLEASKRPWFPASVARLLYQYDWPGNVRELANAVSQLLIANRGAKQMALDADLQRTLFTAKTPMTTFAQTTGLPVGARKATNISEDELHEALKKNAWNINRASKHLKISVSALNRLIEQSTRIRRASDISKAELVEAYESANRSLEGAAARLSVSPRGLLLRMKALGLED